jgi:hypothetical protein
VAPPGDPVILEVQQGLTQIAEVRASLRSPPEAPEKALTRVVN